MNRIEGFTTRWSGRKPLSFDAALATAIAAIEAFNYYYFVYVEDCPCVLSLPLAVVALAGMTVPLVWRRSYPFPSTLVVGAFAVLVSFFETPFFMFGPIVAVFTISAYGTTLQRRIAFAFVAIAILSNTAIQADWEAFPEDLAIFGGAWVLGALQRTRHAYTEELEQRADRLEREREREARLAVAEERSRIARELHDIVAHSMSVMVVNTVAARSTLRESPEKADGALASVEETGRRSLAEMRRLLGLLRASEEAAETAPQPGLDELDELVERFADAGLHVEVVERGHAKTLGPGTDLSAYRITQEALTNVLRHGACDRARVALTWTDDGLDLRITDEGLGGKPTVDGGHGITGMKERAALAGGTLSAGPRPHGGFEVAVELPYEDSA